MIIHIFHDTWDLQIIILVMKDITHRSPVGMCLKGLFLSFVLHDSH